MVTDEGFELSQENFSDFRLPNEGNFFMDDRAEEPNYAKRAEPCMSDCKPGPVTITQRARVLDVTPDSEEEPAGGAVD